MKFLCICQYGHSRSAALVRVLHGAGHEAICLGTATARPETIAHIGIWADVVVVMEPRFSKSVPFALKDKLVQFDIGPDKWSNPYNHNLLEMLRIMAIRMGWVPDLTMTITATPKNPSNVIVFKPED